MARPGEPKTGERAISAAERQVEALKLRKAGLDFRRIAQQLGWAGPGPAHKAVTKALRDIVREPAEELRTLEVERLDAMLLGIWSKASGGDTWAIDRALKIMERRAGLLGLDAPRKIEQTGKDGGAVRHEIEHRVYDHGNLSLREQFDLDQLLAKVQAEKTDG